MSTSWPSEADGAPATVEVVIEIPRFSFLKRGSSGDIDFISPLPCPYNYGSVPTHIGLEGDLLDALVLGPRLMLGQRLELPVWGAVGLRDRGLYDDKLICAREPPSAQQRENVLTFFRFYASAKRVLNWWRGRAGATHCEGFRDPGEAIAACTPRDRQWRGPRVSF